MPKRTKGEGTVYWDENRRNWRGQITLPTGKKKSKSSKNKKEVLSWLAEERSKIDKGIFIVEDKVKLGDFITSYMENVAVHTLRPKTYHSHFGYIKKHIIPYLGKYRLESIRPDHIQAFYTHLKEKGLSARTVQYIHTILHKTLKQAMRWGLVSRNVCDLVDVPKPQRQAPELLTAEQINLFLEHIKDHKYYPIYVVAVYTGMRQGEILGLRVNDVDLVKGYIFVRHQVQWVQGVGFIYSDVKTEKSRRLIPLPKKAVDVLKEHMVGIDSELVFTSSTGNPVYHNNLFRHFKETLKELEFPNVTFHSLRHLHATLLLIEGIHPKVVQERLGHSQISTTLDTYSHTIPSLGREAADRFNDIFK